MPVSLRAEDLIAQLDRLFVEQFELEADMLRPEARLREDLDLDSLDAADMLVLIEKRFGVRMNDEIARTFRTLGDVHAHVYTLIATSERVLASPQVPSGGASS